MKYVKKFQTNSQRTQYEGGSEYIEPYVSLVKEDDTSHYNKPYLCKLTLQDGSKVKLYDVNGNGVLTSAMTNDYKSTLVSAEIGNLCTSIGSSAFAGCENITSIGPVGSGADVEIPNSVTSIGWSAFYNCTGLTSITIPNGITSIGQQPFLNCTGLTSVTIGSGVTSIGQNAFNGCSGLESIISLATTAPSIQSRTFDSVKTGGTLTVPSGSSGYDVWMGTGDYYLGKYNWTKVEQ